MAKQALKPDDVVDGPPALPRWMIWVAAGLILVVGIVAYANSLAGAFVLDDEFTIQKGHLLRPGTPITELLKSPRPVFKLTLRFNYALDAWFARSTKRPHPRAGLGPWGYHLFNVAVHVLAALALFGVVRRTLLSDRLAGLFGRAALPLSLIVALIWLVHPLQTSAVTYVVQRAESLTGLLYLLTLYFAIRAFAAQGSRLWRNVWSVLAVAVCFLGMGCKEIMVGALITVFVYDLIFVGESPKLWGTLRRRWGLYVALTLTYSLLIVGRVFASLSAKGPPSAGFSMKEVTAWTYPLTQFHAICRYLRLSFWPTGLVLDYWWLPAQSVWEVWYYAVIILALLAAIAIRLILGALTG